MGFISAPAPLELMVILVIALIVLGPQKLPEAARYYVERLEALAGVPITHVSVGPERAQMIVR